MISYKTDGFVLVDLPSHVPFDSANSRSEQKKRKVLVTTYKLKAVVSLTCVDQNQQPMPLSTYLHFQHQPSLFHHLNRLPQV